MTAKRMYGPYNQLIFDKLFSLYELSPCYGR